MREVYDRGSAAMLGCSLFLGAVFGGALIGVALTLLVFHFVVGRF